MKDDFLEPYPGYYGIMTVHYLGLSAKHLQKSLRFLLSAGHNLRCFLKISIIRAYRRILGKHRSGRALTWLISFLFVTGGRSL